MYLKLREGKKHHQIVVAIMTFSLGPCTFKMIECTAVRGACVFNDAITTRCSCSPGLTGRHQAPAQGRAGDRHQAACGCGSSRELLNTLSHRYRLKIMLLSLLWTCCLIFFLKLYLRICFKTQMPTKEPSMKSTGPGLSTGSQFHLTS